MGIARAVVVLALLLSGCEGGQQDPGPVWSPVALPDPPGEVARRLPREAAHVAA